VDVDFAESSAVHQVPKGNGREIRVVIRVHYLASAHGREETSHCERVGNGDADAAPQLTRGELSYIPQCGQGIADVLEGLAQKEGASANPK
jgi:hypothetical protein